MTDTSETTSIDTNADIIAPLAADNHNGEQEHNNKKKYDDTLISPLSDETIFETGLSNLKQKKDINTANATPSSKATLVDEWSEISEDDDTYDEGDGEYEQDPAETEAEAEAARKRDAEQQEADLARAFFSEFEYTTVPPIPPDWRASEIIGRRTKPSGGTALSIGPIQPKRRLVSKWEMLTDVEKYILMLISEHRHMTVKQLAVLILTPTYAAKTAGLVDNCRTYWRWTTEERYHVKLDYKKTFQTRKLKGLYNILTKLCEPRYGLLEEIVPSYGIDESNVDRRVKTMPALYTRHYYLTVEGAKVLICNTAANRPSKKQSACPVGFVPSYRDAAYMSILHESECTEVMCSMISCASYASNADDGRYGLIDLCRFYHERATEEHVRSLDGRRTKVTFKPDGKIVFYSQSADEFIDCYLEYDSGSSRESNIKHKIHAYYLRNIEACAKRGIATRLPVMLLVSQKPSSYFPELSGRKSTTYTTAIKRAVKDHLEKYERSIDLYGAVFVSDCGQIRDHGALGAIWHRVDMRTGLPERHGRDLIDGVLGFRNQRRELARTVEQANAKRAMRVAETMETSGEGE